jgi:hypothetical protein
MAAPLRKSSHQRTIARLIGAYIFLELIPLDGNLIERIACVTEDVLNGTMDLTPPNMPAPTDDMPISPSGLVRPQAVVKDVKPPLTPNDPA